MSRPENNQSSDNLFGVRFNTREEVIEIRELLKEISAQRYNAPLGALTYAFLKDACLKVLNK